MDKNRFYALDLLRFFAAFAVVMYHYTYRKLPSVVDQSTFEYIGEISKFGYLGVNIFFMISGFVILLSAMNRNATQFAISRSTRLYPTYWVCVTITSIILISLNGDAANIDFVKYVANMSMLNDYVGIGNIDSVYWTLQAEIKFYLCIFILVLFGWVKHYKAWISVWLAVTVTYWLFGEPYFMGWFISPFYSCYFIAGATFYLAMKNGYRPFYIIVIVISYFLAAANSSQQLDSYIKSPNDIDRFIAVLLLSFFYWVFYLFSKNKINLPKRKYILLLGGVTYPLYLLHAKAGKTIFDLIVNYIDPYLSLFLLFSFMLALSLIIHLYIEKKLSNLIKNKLIVIIDSLVRNLRSFLKLKQQVE